MPSGESKESNGLPKALTASDKDSFAYPTIKDRVPVIICKVIDLLHRQRLHLGLKDADGLKKVIEMMSKLRYELQTNKPFAQIQDQREDQDVWNEYLTKRSEFEGETPRWFNTCWMYSECYAYRRLLECMAQSQELRDFDFFVGQKQDGFKDNLDGIDAMAEILENMLSGGHADLADPDKLINDFRRLMETSLWGNRCDLSITAGNKQETDATGDLSRFRANLLVDDWNKVWDCLMSSKLMISPDGKKQMQRQLSSGSASAAAGDIVVDIIMDNAGFEAFSDLCLADFLVTSGLASQVRLRVKCHPWFVSDVKKSDLEWLLNELGEGAVRIRKGESFKIAPSKSSSATSLSSLMEKLNAEELVKVTRMKKLSDKWKNYFTVGSWTIHSDPFWTYPHDFSLLKRDDPDLYNSLSEASLIIFKGDLNYRKLVGDLNWDPTTPFQKSLQDFHPAPIVSLRTLKADVITGLEPGQVEKTKELDKDWMLNGKMGIIQFCDIRE